MAKKRAARKRDTNGSPVVNNEQQDKEKTLRILEKELVSNVLMSRSSLMKSMLDPRRSINDDCGYPETSEINSQDYRELYDRSAIATRVVQVLPKESWQASPTIFESEDAEQTTPFETAWEELGRVLRFKSWFQDEEGNPVWEHLMRADILSGIGGFGVLLLGIDDGLELSEPLEPGKNRKLLFLRSFDESLVDISHYETDQKNPRFGMPVMYLVRFNDPRDNVESGIGLPISTMQIHWTRIIHLADNLGSSEVLGVSRQRPVYNRLLDLRKLYGGSAEMYWRGAFPGFSIQSHPQIGPDIEFDILETRNQMEQYMNSLQRYLALGGVDVKSLAPQVVDPTPQIDAQLNAICIQLGIPKRVFTGSERGELASSQDIRTWNGRLRFRQNTYITPRIIVPFVDRLITLGVLPEPQGYSVVWPDLDALSADEKATVAVKQTEALAKYVQGGVEQMLPPLEFYIAILKMPEDEAKAILEAAFVAEPLFDEEEDEDEDKKEEENQGAED